MQSPRADFTGKKYELTWNFPNPGKGNLISGGIQRCHIRATRSKQKVGNNKGEQN